MISDHFYYQRYHRKILNLKLDLDVAGSRLQREGRRLALRVGADPPQEPDAAQAREALPPLQQVRERHLEGLRSRLLSKVNAHMRWCKRAILCFGLEISICVIQCVPL